MTVSRVSSGLTSLDNALQGGYPKGAVISLYGTSSPDRKTIGLAFLHGGINQSQNCLYITTRNSMQTIQQYIKRYNKDLSTVVFLDAVHWRIKRVNPELSTPAKYEVNNLTDLNALLAKIMEACKAEEIDRILFDSMTPILLYTTPGKEQVFKFFELLTAFTRSNDITICYTLEHGVLPSDIVATLHYLSDGVITCGSNVNGNKTNEIKIEQMILTDFSETSIEIDEKLIG